jgi:MoxR-like ATPase
MVQNSDRMRSDPTAEVTLGTDTHALHGPFIVLATQNPIEQEGTYPFTGSATGSFSV